MDRNRVDAKLESLSADNTKMSESVQNLTQMLTTTMTESRALSETNAQLREDNRALNQRLADMASQLIHAQEKVTQTVERMSEMQSVGNVSSAELDGVRYDSLCMSISSSCQHFDCHARRYVVSSSLVGCVLLHL